MDNDRDLTNDDVVYVPVSALPDTRDFSELGCVTVNGEIFAMRRSDPDGAIHYSWVSGPNDGYGFSTSGGSTPQAHVDHAAAIRDFLAGIDPDTGYLAHP